MLGVRLTLRVGEELKLGLPVGVTDGSGARSRNLMPGVEALNGALGGVKFPPTPFPYTVCPTIRRRLEMMPWLVFPLPNKPAVNQFVWPFGLLALQSAVAVQMPS